MITPTPLNAPVGTDVVCVDASPSRAGYGDTGLVSGKIYTVLCWRLASNGLGVCMTEISWRLIFYADRFRLLDLAGLDDLLKTEAPNDLELTP